MKKYTALLVIYDSEKKRGNAEGANEIAASLSVGRKLHWKIPKLVWITSKFMHRDVANDALRDRLHSYWDLDAEFERLTGKNYNPFSWLANMIDEYSSETKCAPLMLIRAQAAINHAFKTTFEVAQRKKASFDNDSFERIAVFQFRVPGVETSQIIDGLLQRSSIGRRLIGNNVKQRVTLCPGIERALEESEKEEIVEVAAGVVDGRDFVKAVCKDMCRKKNGAGYYDLFDVEDNVWGRALEYFDDQCWLIVDDFIRAQRGWGVLGNDGVVRSHIVALKW